ncbi:alternate-type signal peptide domain-containing protein [Gordonia sihwensis]|uniref:alternate-type signal peptide domain-containing protein n=1 Tax=Gordonia TaxID=2053 RepID=UPI002415D540|nr:alternate-type signal peptide domain-containing protein [Gordonia sihwensis]WFN92442.1 alternate-type signal peptide domain-containing protein [Gordonia sihwensis]
MNKATKGAIAAAAGALILAGGAGTMAAWNSQVGGNTTAVTAGSLNVTQTGTGSWTWADGTAFNPATDFLVPGDSVKYVAEYNITLKGTNLKAELVPTVGGVSGLLAPYLTATTAGATGNETIESSGTRTITTTVLFDPAKVTDNTSMDKPGSLNGAAVTLTQKLSS